MKTSGNKLQKRTLLYLASGEYFPDYENLPYDKVILVDKAAAINQKSTKQFACSVKKDYFRYRA